MNFLVFFATYLQPICNLLCFGGIWWFVVLVRVLGFLEFCRKDFVLSIPFMFRSASLSCDPASFFENKEAGGRKKQASESPHPTFQPCF